MGSWGKYMIDGDGKKLYLFTDTQVYGNVVMGDDVQVMGIIGRLSSLGSVYGG